MKDLIQSKLGDYLPQTAEEEENALKEITQEVLLYELYRAGFFSKACFQGGTCLRIVHGIDRFSEDLDFALHAPDPHFDLTPYLKNVSAAMTVYGYNLEIQGADQAESNVRTRFLKDDSLKKLLNLKHQADFRKKIKIKIEVDANPPAGAVIKQSYVDFPTDFPINAHDLQSLFAGKCHALLCRVYIKGRDWYDFSWYVAKGILMNYDFLSHALDQTGPWKNKKVQVNGAWIEEHLKNKILKIDWQQVKQDVARFLKPEKQAVLALWNADFFLRKLEKLKK